MILLLLSQDELEMTIATFDSVEQGREFLAMVPGYKRVDEEIAGYPYTYETLDPVMLPDYVEIDYRGNLFPLTRLMFDGTEEIDIFWQEIPHLDQPDQGLVSGNTKVDAYLIENAEVKQYIEQREHGYRRVAAVLEKMGYRAGRDYAGSEDGEAITFAKQGEADEHILAYLDPEFVAVAELEDDLLSDWVKSKIAELA